MKHQYPKAALVTLADAHYLEQAKQFFSSAYWNAGWKGDFVLLAHDIDDSRLTWFKDKGIFIYHCKPISTEKIGVFHHPPTVLSKFYVFTSYFKRWDKVLFFDGDIIVRASLDDLLSVKSFAAPAATGIDFKRELVNDGSEIYKEARKMARFNNSAFNSGVFAFDTRFLLSMPFDRLMRAYKRYKSISCYGEEGVMNIAFQGQWEKLPLPYNVYPGYMHMKYGINSKDLDAIVIHFVASTKPWINESPFYEEWSKSRAAAETMNLSMRRDPVKIWSDDEMCRYEKHMRGSLLRRVWGSIKLKTDARIGRVGMFMERRFNYLYRLLKRVLEMIWSLWYGVRRMMSLSFVVYKLDQSIGLVGIGINRVSPRLYHVLKRYAFKGFQR